MEFVDIVVCIIVILQICIIGLVINNNNLIGKHDWITRRLVMEQAERTRGLINRINLIGTKER